jgi:hypothetical protein
MVSKYISMRIDAICEVEKFILASLKFAIRAASSADSIVELIMV